jgi:hypothetical protein
MNLKQKVEENRLRINNRKQKNYKLAKELGFSSAEAHLIRCWSQSKIKELAEERKKGDG